MALFDRGGAGQEAQDYDPLFYRGRTPVLGAPVELKTSGELPGQFPSAGPAPPTPPTAGAPGGGPSVPSFNFDFGGLDFPAPPTGPGGAPSGLFGPGGQRPSWLEGGLEIGSRVQQGYSDLRKLGHAPAEGGPIWTSSPSDFSLFGPEGAPSLNPTDFSLTGDPNAPVLTPDQFSLTGGEGAAAAPTGGLGPGSILPGLALAGGVFGAITSPTAGGKALSAAGAASGGLTLASQLAPEALGALGPAGTALGLAALAPELGLLYNRYFGPDVARFPKNYVQVPDSPKYAGAMAVDPTTGAILVYQGHGRYGWSDQTQKGERVTPEQLTKWNIDPAGELLGLPGYTAVKQALFQKDITRGSSADPNSPQGPGVQGPPPSPAHQQEFWQQFRQSAIDRIKAAHPGLSEAEIWHLYTVSPDYQTELAMRQQLGWDTPGHQD